MAKCAIVFDSVSGIKDGDFPDTYILPIPIIEDINGKFAEYYENVNITNEGIIDKLISGVTLKTSQTIPRELFKLMDKLSDQYDQVFVFPNPPQISKQYENVKMHCADYSNVHVFQHNTVGAFSLWMCQEFVKLNKSNKLTKESIEKYLAENKDDVAGALIIPEVKYLTRSGRLTPIKGAVAQMLGYKIVISYTDAGLQMFNKTRDTDKLADIAYDVIKATLKNFDQKKITHFSLGINGYSNRHFNLVEIKKNVANKFNLPSKVKPYNLNLSSIITCHTGPNYVVLCVKAKKN